MSRKSTPAAARAAAMAIVQVLRNAGHVAYFAGGCVRDELLGLSPTDYDVATDAVPERIKSLFKRTNEVGEAFGVVLVTPTEAEGVQDRATVEVATFRSDGPYSDRRRPDSIAFSDPQSDAKRRDFTVNALFLDPLAAQQSGASVSGSIIDFVGGREDIARRVIRAVGNPEARLSEDHLRALRAVRLAAKLGFELDPPTAEAIERHARDLRGVSRERIGEEVRRMLHHPSRASATALLERLALDAPVLNERPTKSSGKALAETTSKSYSTFLAAWACDRGLKLDNASIKDLAGRWRGALSLSNEERADLIGVLDALRQIEGSWGELGVAAQKRLAGQNSGFSSAIGILGSRRPELALEVQARVTALTSTPSGLCPDPLLTGDDLIAAGFAPGPGFKPLLEAVYDAQMEDRVRTQTEALELARRVGV